MEYPIKVKTPIKWSRNTYMYVKLLFHGKEDNNIKFYDGACFGSTYAAHNHALQAKRSTDFLTFIMDNSLPEEHTKILLRFYRACGILPRGNKRVKVEIKGNKSTFTLSAKHWNYSSLVVLGSLLRLMGEYSNIGVILLRHLADQKVIDAFKEANVPMEHLITYAFYCIDTSTGGHTHIANGPVEVYYSLVKDYYKEVQKSPCLQERPFTLERTINTFFTKNKLNGFTKGSHSMKRLQKFLSLYQPPKEKV